MRAPCRLVIDRQSLELATRHAERLYPLESCGFLFGRVRGDRARVITAEPAANALGDGGESGFAIAAGELLLALRRAAARDEALIGFYHSHPDRDANPSATDREEGWRGVSQLIVPVHCGRAGAPRSWRLYGGMIVEEGIEII